MEELDGGTVGEEEDPLELSDLSKDKLTDASKDDEAVEVLAELERDSEPLELVDEETRSIAVDSDKLLDSELDESRDRELDESPADTEPALEADESRIFPVRAETLVTTTVARTRTWDTFMSIGTCFARKHLDA